MADPVTLHMHGSPLTLGNIAKTPTSSGVAAAGRETWHRRTTQYELANHRP